MLRSMSRVGLLAMMVVLAGCAGDGGGYKTIGTASAGSCKEWRNELNRLEARGIPSRIEAQQAGAKVSAQTQADINRYNDLLARYLGGQCHQ